MNANNVRKFVVVGDPHCGKSVFLGALCKNLPRSMRFLFRACPDGEGTWLQQHYDDPKVVELRRKGSFTPEIVEWYAKSLASNTMAPIVLVDVGGRCSEENRQILSEGGVHYGIILVRDEEGLKRWQEFLASLNIKIIAELVSGFLSTSDQVNVGVVMTGTIHHLDREDSTVSTRPAIVAVAEKILSLAIKEEPVATNLISDGVLSVNALANTLGKATVDRALPNGKVVSQIVWEGVDLKAIAKLMHIPSAELPDPVDIDGAAPAWLVSALAHECHPKSVRLNSPDGFIAVGCRRPDGNGAGCTWIKTEAGEADERKLIKVEFQLDPSIPLNPAMLDKIAPPEVYMGDVVILSGRGPNWLVASVAMAYHGRVAAVACWQPGTGATVCWTHVSDVELGSVFS